MQAPVADVQAIFTAACRRVQADRLLIPAHWTTVLPRPMETFRKVVVVGAGKAAMAMAGAVEATLPGHGDTGEVVVPQGYRASFPAHMPRPDRIRVAEGGHPVPNEAGALSARRAFEQATFCQEDDLLLVLLSGGASSLWALPLPGLTLADVQDTTRLLLQCGADIHQTNTVRKHLLALAGGRLAVAAWPAHVCTLLLSDIPGDDRSVMGSGPTVPDTTTPDDAVAVLQDRGIWMRVPDAVRQVLAAPVAASPHPDHPGLRQAVSLVIGNNQLALEAARQEARRLGFDARIVAANLRGEARRVGVQIADEIKRAQSPRPTCLLWGGETTVTVHGDGRGGRNQELALAVALELSEWLHPVAFLSGGTDGIDGLTDAAGAWVTAQSVTQAWAQGLEPERYLRRNDAYTFFQQVGGLLKTGPTHTNVMDVMVACF